MSATNAAGTGPASGSVMVTPYPALLATSSAKLWLDAASTPTLFTDSAGTVAASVGSGVGRWVDRSGHDFDATVLPGIGKPVLTAAAINGHAALRFDRTDPDWMQITTAGIGALASADRSLFVVGSARTTQDNDQNRYGGFLNWPGFHTGISGEGYPSATVLESAGWTSTGGYVGATGSVTWPAVIEHIASSNAGVLSVSAHRNGVLLGTGSSAPSSAWRSYSNLARIGAANVAPDTTWLHTLDGDIGEILGFDRTLNTSERRVVEEYLSRKWSQTITPSSPTAVTGVTGNAQVALSWTAPTWNGGAAITSYTATASPGGSTCTATAPATSCTVTGLTNGSAYTFTVTATNTAGTGPASAASPSYTPVGPPGAPTGVAATSADTTSSVSWTAPASTGGSPITGYTATAVPGDGTLPTRTCTSASSPCTLTALTNGATYTVTVTATNAVGTGAASSAATAVPYPTTLFASSSLKVWLDAQHSASLSAATDCSGSGASAGTGIGCWKDRSGNAWNAVAGSTKAVHTASAINGRAAIRFTRTNPDYYAVTSAGIGAVGSADRTMLAVTTVRTTADNATNIRGAVAMWSGYHSGLYSTGYPSATTIGTVGYNTSNASVSTDVAISGPFLVSSVSSATGGQIGQSLKLNSGTAQTAQVAGTWRSYGDNLRVGSVFNTITNYAYPLDGDIGELLVFNRALTTTELRSVEEFLARHWGLGIAPQAPTSVAGTGGDAQVALSWTAPTWNGGAAITSYTATASPGGSTCTATAPATSCTVTGLTNGSAYTFTVTATNTAGTGPASAASPSYTPVGPPGAPTAVAATASTTTSGTAQVTWTPPTDNGGSPITAYTATAVPGAAGLTNVACTAASSPCTLTGMIDGVAYTVTVTATSSVGTGAASSPVSLTSYPASIMTTSAMRLWLDGADLSSMFTASGCSGAVTTTGQAVGCWRDKSGQGNDLSQGTANRRPTTTSFGGLVVPQFDGSNDAMARGSSTLPIGTSASTTFVVATTTNASPATDVQRSLLLWSSGVGQGRFVYKPSSSAAAATNADGTTGATDGAYTTNAPMVSVSSFSSGSYSIRALGRPPVAQTYAYNTASGAGISLSLTTSSWQGPLQEIITLNSAASAADIRTIEEYLARKWNAAITPPAPVSASASAAAGSANVSWTAPAWDGGAAITSYSVTPSGSGSCTWISGTTASCAGLTGGQPYTFTIRATNSIGTGPAATTNTATP